MTTATLIGSSAVTVDWSAARPAPSRTLDEVLTGAWSELNAIQSVDCLVCGEAMLPRCVAGSGTVGGRCRGCGSTLS